MDANPMPLDEVAGLIREAKTYVGAAAQRKSVAASRADLNNTMWRLRTALDRLAALSQPPAVPEGWALVPVEPTREMVEAACTWKGDVGTVTRTYAAMVSAAPPAPSSDPLAPICSAIADYHYALDTRQHGGVAADRALNAVQMALGMEWRQGAEKARRDAAQAQEGGK